MASHGERAAAGQRRPEATLVECGPSCTRLWRMQATPQRRYSPLRATCSTSSAAPSVQSTSCSWYDMGSPPMVSVARPTECTLPRRVRERRRSGYGERTAVNARLNTSSEEAVLGSACARSHGPAASSVHCGRGRRERGAGLDRPPYTRPYERAVVEHLVYVLPRA